MRRAVCLAAALLPAGCFQIEPLPEVEDEGEATEAEEQGEDESDATGDGQDQGDGGDGDGDGDGDATGDGDGDTGPNSCDVQIEGRVCMNGTHAFQGEPGPRDLAVGSFGGSGVNDDVALAHAGGITIWWELGEDSPPTEVSLPNWPGSVDALAGYGELTASDLLVLDRMSNPQLSWALNDGNAFISYADGDPEGSMGSADCEGLIDIVELRLDGGSGFSAFYALCANYQGTGSRALFFASDQGGGFNAPSVVGTDPLPGVGTHLAVLRAEGDMVPELVVAVVDQTNGGTDLYLYPGSAGAPTLVEDVPLEAGMDFVQAPVHDMAEADLNEDGVGELLLAVEGEGFRWMRFDAGMMFGDSMSYDAGGADGRLALGDFDGDSRIDVLVVPRAEATINQIGMLLHSQEDGLMFEPAEQIPVVGTKVVDAVAANVNNDGRSDIVLAGSDAGGMAANRVLVFVSDDP